MGGMALPAVINYGYGYLQGANDAAKELNIKVSAKYTYTGTFNESPEIKTKATGWHGGTDVTLLVVDRFVTLSSLLQKIQTKSLSV